MKFEIPNKVLGAMALGGASFVAGLSLAAEFPATEGALVYSGLVTDSAGNPSEDSVTLVVTLYDAGAAGAALCTATEPAVDLSESHGRFAVPMPEACADAIAEAGEVWAQVKVGSTTMPRHKVGSVPFALVARQAQSAHHAEVAGEAQALAAGAVDDAQLAPALGARLEALEAAVNRVLVVAGISAAQSIPSTGIHIDWNVETVDSHSALAGTRFTAPASGTYQVCAKVNYFEVAQWPLGADIWVQLDVTRVPAVGEEYLQVDLRRQQMDWNGRLNIIGGCGAISLGAGESFRVHTGQNIHSDARPVHPHSTQLLVIGL